MENSRRRLTLNGYQLTLVIAGSLLVILGLTGLLSFIDVIMPLAQIGRNYIPMAADTGLIFLIFGMGFIFNESIIRRKSIRMAFVALAGFLSFYALLTLLEFILQMDLTFQDWMFPGYKEKEIYPKTGISPVTSFLFLLSGLALIFHLLVRSGKTDRHLVNITGTLVMIIGLVGFLGYLFGTPFLYAGIVIPMSAPTTVSFMVLGRGLQSLTGKGSYWLTLFNRATTRGRLMRVILPLVVSAILIQGLILVRLGTAEHINQTILSVLMTLLFSIITPVAIFRVSKVIYRKMEKAECEKLETQELLHIEQDRLRILIDNLPDQIYFKDRASRFMIANKEVAKVTGAASPGDVIGKTDFDFFPQELSAQYFAKEQELMSRGEPLIDFEEPIVKADGKPGWVLTNKIPICNLDGEVIGLVGIGLDVTEAKKAHGELVAAKEAAEQASRLKDYFIANLSHEIRTPLNAIIGFTELLKEEVSGYLPDAGEQYFPVITSAGLRLMRTIDLILNLSRLQSGMYSIRQEEVDLDRIIHNLVKECSLVASKKGVTLEYLRDTDLTLLETDEYCVTQSISNLIDNALKYTDRGRVNIRLYQENKGSVIVEVKDTGIGISDEYLKKIFEPFTQEDNSFTRSYEGIGLGLAISKQLLEAVGGRIDVTSVKNQGSTFTIEFPRGQRTT